MAANNLWERQETDTPKSYEAFHVYLTMGRKRSLLKVGEQLGKSEGLIERWSFTHNWGKRIEAYDSHLADIDRANYEDKRLASRKSRQAIVQGLESFLGKIMETSVDKKSNTLTLKIQDLQQLSSAAKTIMTESRNEFNDLPIQKTDNVNKNVEMTWEEMMRRGQDDTDSE